MHHVLNVRFERDNATLLALQVHVQRCKGAITSAITSPSHVLQVLVQKQQACTQSVSCAQSMRATEGLANTQTHTHFCTCMHIRAHMHACMQSRLYTHMRTHTAGHINEPHLTVLSMPPDTQTLDPSKGLAATPNTTTWPWIFIACFSRPLAISQTLWVRTCVCFWE